jgi:hypothetical protein
LARAMTFPISGTSGPPAETLCRQIALCPGRWSDEWTCRLIDGLGKRAHLTHPEAAEEAWES